MQGLLRLIRFVTRPRMSGSLAVAGALIVAALAVRAQQQPDFRDSPYLRIDPSRIRLSERDWRVPCGECHGSEYEVWRQTNHAEGFNTMHRKESALDILKNMGLTVTKRQESLCMRCHYTVGPELKAIAGVSCESCHGPALDWMDTHNNWGDGVDHPDREAPAHKQQRIAQSTAAGMLRPSGNLYAVAANCYECHTVPLEDLVNKGRHATGSARFELVERTREIRHNFVQAQWGGDAANRAPTPERTRMIFAIGKVLAYEYSVRGLAAATSEGRYFKAMEKRTQESYRALEDVARASNSTPIKQILQIGEPLRLVPGNEEALLAAADRIRAAGLQFATTADGTALAGLDPLVAGGTLREPESPPEPPAQAQTTAAAGGDSARTATTTGQASTPGTSPAAASTPEPALPTLPGRIRGRPEWIPAPSSQYTTELADCGKCHDDSQEWWDSDKHESTAARLLNKQPRAREIATLYGIDPDQMSRGNFICMNCHGTVRSAAPTAQVRVGVTCERCHGPSSGYLEPHEDGGNPQLGMTALKQAPVQAKTCAGCHRITDERLLAASHPSGEQYDIAAATEKIRHWPDRRPDRARNKRGESAYAGPAAAALRSAFQQEAGARAIPRVTVARLPDRPAAAGGARPTQPDRAGQTTRTTQPTKPRLPSDQVSRREEPQSSSVPPNVGDVPRVKLNAIPVEVDAIPPMADTLTSEALLLLVKRRLELLYAQLARTNRN